MENIKKYFIVGITVILPVFITAYAFVAVLHFTDKLIGKTINSILQNRFGFFIPGLGIFLVVIIILAIGFLYSFFFGRRLFSIFEYVFQRIPFASDIYQPVKQLSNFLLGKEEKKRFKKVVLVEYPSPGSYSIGFVTNEDLGPLYKEESLKLISVFVPFPPTPLSGFMLLIPREKTVTLDISIEQAMKFIISGGIFLPNIEKKIEGK